MMTTTTTRIETPLTELLGVPHPLILAGMNVSRGRLAAAVSNAGGFGVIGGVSLTPAQLKKEIEEVQSLLRDPTNFGVDLLLPEISERARKTNKDYTKGALHELIEVVCASKCKMFVSAVGVCPKEVVERLHACEPPVYVMNLVGHPKHVERVCAAGVDIVCCVGTEGGGHGGEISTMVLLPQVLEAVAGKISPVTRRQIPAVVGGGIYNGMTMAAALQMGASGVWVGTRFICAEESNAPRRLQEAVLQASSDSTIRTTLFTGRPLRALRTKYNYEWETTRKREMLELESKGVIAFTHDRRNKNAEALDPSNLPLFLGQAAGGITKIMPAKDIVEEMVSDCVKVLREPKFKLVARV